jgi:hypothetical protein
MEKIESEAARLPRSRTLRTKRFVGSIGLGGSFGAVNAFPFSTDKYSSKHVVDAGECRARQHVSSDWVRHLKAGIDHRDVFCAIEAVRLVEQLGNVRPVLAADEWVAKQVPTRDRLRAVIG